MLQKTSSWWFAFLQENDQKGTVKATIELFMLKHSQVLQWLSQSQDSKPIENIWKNLKINL